MKNTDAFSGYHPLVNFLYFGLVIGFSMFFMHPVSLLISCICSAVYYVRLNGGKSFGFLFRFAFPAMLFTALINPLFNHRGGHVLCRFPNGSPLTLESILYGVSAAVMLVTVFLWFGCYTAVMSSDKFVYMFGRVIPSLSLVLSMTLRFVPSFKARLEAVKEAQAGLNRGAFEGNLKKRLKSTARCFSIMVTWALENSIDTADSIKSRGYGLDGRTAFSVYTPAKRDRLALCWLCLCAVCIIGGAAAGGFYWRYFPDIRGALARPLTVGLGGVYLLLCVTPLIINAREERAWKSLRSKT